MHFIPLKQMRVAAAYVPDSGFCGVLMSVDSYIQVEAISDRIRVQVLSLGDTKRAILVPKCHRQV